MRSGMSSPSLSIYSAGSSQYMVIIINLYRYYNHIHQDSQLFGLSYYVSCQEANDKV